MAAFVARLLRPYWASLTALFVAMIVETLMSLAQPWPLKIVLDSVLGSHPLPGPLQSFQHTIFGHGKLSALSVAAAFVVIIALVDAIASYIDSYLSTSIGQYVAHDLRRNVYAHLQRLSVSYYDTHQTADLLSTITDDVDAVQSFASNSVLDILIDVLTVVGMLAVMFYLNWDFTLMALALTPLLALFAYRLRHVVKRAQKDVRAKESEMLSVIQEGLSSIRVVKAFARGQYEESRLEVESQESIHAALRARRVKALMSPFVSLVVAAGTALVLLYGGRLVLAGTMTIGALVVFLQYLGKLFKPIEDLAKTTNSAAQAAVGLDRIRQILDTDAVLPVRDNAIVATGLTGDVVFDHVSFGYDPAHPVLHDVDFHVSPGQMVGIVGATGGGKSTVISLVPRFYDPTSGMVRLDGTDLRAYKLSSLRNQIAFVMQDTVLFRATVAENIAYGRPDATRDEIVRAAKLANADDFIRQMPNGYDTMVGERGSTMSGGQRQRIGIARAVIRNSPILILDEATSGLDAESEKLVTESLERLMKGRTAFVIAHRLATIRDAALILVVRDGHIIERGTHDQLLAMNGFYAQLHAVQFADGEQQPAGIEASAATAAVAES